MAFCKDCGQPLFDDAKFCTKCGTLAIGNVEPTIRRQQEFAGTIFKCPNCGEALKSFMTTCHTCGFELRGLKTTTAARELTVKLEAVESKREYQKPRSFINRLNNKKISETDEQKISLIRGFTAPNTKEDLLEFLILAASNIDIELHNSFKYTNVSKDDSCKAISDAWQAMFEQVYQKAKISFTGDADFIQIENIHNNLYKRIHKEKVKGIRAIILAFTLPLVFIIIIGILGGLSTPQINSKEEARMEAIIVEINEALTNEEYYLALLNAQSLDYDGYDKESKRKWDIQREMLINRIIEEAEKNGIILTNETEENRSLENPSGFIEGFKEGIQPSIDSMKENIDEFNRMLNGDSP